MRTPTHLFLLSLSALNACTFNVATFERSVTHETTDPITTLRLASANVAVEGPIRVHGAPRSGAAATLVVSGLLGASGDTNAAATRLVDSIVASWPVATDGAAELTIDCADPNAENVQIAELDLVLSETASLDVSVTSGSIEVDGLTSGLIAANTSSGTITVRNGARVDLSTSSGAIDAQAASGSIAASSGAIHATFAGPLTARTSSGSIRGTFGGHAKATTGSALIDLELLGPLDGDVTLRASSGPITLVVPAGTAAQVTLTTSSGGVSVRAGGVSYEGRGWGGILNGGGPHTLRIETTSGSIALRER